MEQLDNETSLRNMFENILIIILGNTDKKLKRAFGNINTEFSFDGPTKLHLDKINELYPEFPTTAN